MPTNAISTYSPEQKVGVEIYKYNEELKEKIYFSKLVNIFEGKISRSTINKALDKLFDLCMIYAEWEEVDNKWVRSLYISGGEYKHYFKMLYNNVKDSSKPVETNC
jgi:hypothetical protein